MSEDELPDRPITTQMELEDVWHELMGPLGFSGPSIWLMAIGPDGRPDRRLIEITEADEPPGPEQAAGFGEFLRMLTTELVPGGRVALLRTRPGEDGLNEQDREWAAALYAAARAAGVPCDVIHMADDRHLVPVPLDEITVPRSA